MMVVRLNVNVLAFAGLLVRGPETIDLAEHLIAISRHGLHRPRLVLALLFSPAENTAHFVEPKERSAQENVGSMETTSPCKTDLFGRAS